MGEQPDTARVGTQFGRYEIRARVGDTGVGEVYQAVDTTDNRAVGLTLLPPTADRQRFFRELGVVAELAEPHILPLHDWGEVDGVC
jgi:serine/threonine-protein kinase